MRKFCPLVMIVFLISCASPAVEDDKASKTIKLSGELPKAAITVPGPDMVLARAASLGGDEQPAIFMHPPALVEFPPVALGKLPVLTSSFGLEDAVMDKPGDGVDFIVRVKRPDGSIVDVWSKYLDTRKNPADRGWQHLRVPLEQFAGQTIRLILSTSLGADSQYDWAVWGNPILETGSR